MFDLHGHVALVTGGNSGIGLGMAAGLAGQGADVAIWGTNESKNADAAAQLAGYGTRVKAFRCDVGDEAEVSRAMAATLAEFGQVDSCFANAGIGGGAPSFMEMSLEEWTRVLRVNLDGAFLTMRAAARHMVERGEGGNLVVTASLAAIEGGQRNQHYAASKGAVISMTRSLAVELARHRVRANAILPGWIDTPMTEGVLGWDRFRDKVLPRIPARRWGEPEDFAGAAVYFASPASSYHTGDTLIIDGGYRIF
ncbi:MAG TPA: SDR family NAD(P)-dependent oxidoreductase [Acidimicrobiales bacterium]|nr:SDR family NAD(P)-dependent oxidoreductase [Acidimicrobiales bacterium]